MIDAVTKNPKIMSYIAIGIEKTPTNQEYQGKIPKNISPPPINKNQN